ncbi:hypothetical protein D3C72_1830190 [compost metagenome]
MTKPGGSASAMVGTSGKNGERAAAVTASTRIWPLRTYCVAVPSTGMPNWVWPVSIAVTISGAPL